MPESDIAELRQRIRSLESENARLESEVAAVVETLPRLRQMIEYSPGLLFLHDGDGRIVDCNAHAMLTLDRSMPELIGADISEFMAEAASDDADSAGLECAMGDFSDLLAKLEPGRTISAKRRFGGVGSTPFPAEVSTACFMSQEKKLFVSVAIDISELEASHQQVVRAGELRKRFFANMSHELRTPLNGVLGLTALLKNSPLNEAQLEMIRTMEQSGRTLLTTINDILDFSRIESEKIELDRTEFCLVDVLRGVVKPLAVIAHDKGIELLLDIEPGLVPLRTGDPARLSQILTNLLSNAIKFTAEGAVSLSVSVTEYANDGLKFTVTDTGIGISADRQQMIFEPFSQEKPSTCREYGGTGLGLAISKHIVEAMGSTLTLTSEPGIGSSFSFAPMLPAADSGALHNDTAFDTDTFDRVVCVSTVHSPYARAGDQLRELGLCVDEARSLHEFAATIDKVDQDHTDSVLAVFELGAVEGISDAEWALIGRTQRRPGASLLLLHPANFSAGDRERLTSADNTQLLTRPADTQLLKRTLTMMTKSTTDQNPVCEPSEETRPAGSGSDVLLVEDNPVNQLVASKMLEVLGVSAQIAENGELAVEAVAKRSYDLVLMDCQMPVMNGYDATRAIREFNTDVPIVAVTAHALDGEREKCMRVGMNDYLAKPIQLDQLRTILDKWLPESGTADIAKAKTA